MTVRQFKQKRGDCGHIWLLAVLVVGASHLTTAAQDYTFTINTGAVTITGYTGPGGPVRVPPAIDGLPVTSIGEGAFADSFGVTSIAIPDTVTNVGLLAFLSCTSLTNVTISSGVIGLGELSFKNCVSLTDIMVDTNNPVFSGVGGVLFDKDQTTLVQYPQGKTAGCYAVPAGVQSIGYGAFYDCTELTNLSLPAGLENIGDAAFSGCTKLAAARIPKGVTNVGVEAFSGCQSLTQLVIPDSVVNLGFSAFFACGGATNATIGNNVRAIGNSTFASCSSLSSVTVGNGVASLGINAFEYCQSLASLTLGSSLTNIGDSAFSYCFALPDVTIPNGVTTIGSQAFWYCDSLSTINLPASVTSIGDRVFEFCGGLTAITVDPGNPAYESNAGVLFDQRSARLVQYPANNPRSSYPIPAGTASVADTAFVSAYFLTSVTIPASLTNLETLAFCNCPEVAGFFFEGNAPALGDSVFDLDDAAKVYCLAGTSNWGPTLGGLPTELWNPQVQVAPAASLLQPFGFTIAGAANIPVVVETSTNLAAGSWTAVASVVLTNGSFDFVDPQSTNYPGRYYRIRSP